MVMQEGPVSKLFGTITGVTEGGAEVATVQLVAQDAALVNYWELGTFPTK